MVTVRFGGSDEDDLVFTGEALLIDRFSLTLLSGEPDPDAPFEKRAVASAVMDQVGGTWVVVPGDPTFRDVGQPVPVHYGFKSLTVTGPAGMPGEVMQVYGMSSGTVAEVHLGEGSLGTAQERFPEGAAVQLVATDG